jgi:hypothetical protein
MTDDGGINVKVCECGAMWFGGNAKYCPSGHPYLFRTKRYVPARSPQGEDHEELIRNLLVAWLNGWEPGENQDLINLAEKVLK